jgi:hypothetical protein
MGILRQLRLGSIQVGNIPISLSAFVPDMHGKAEMQISPGLQGEAHFPRKTVRASVLTRVSKFISGFGPHESLGSDAKIGVQRPGYGDMPNDNVIATWDGFATRVNSHLVLHKCPKGFTG